MNEYVKLAGIIICISIMTFGLVTCSNVLLALLDAAEKEQQYANEAYERAMEEYAKAIEAYEREMEGYDKAVEDYEREVETPLLRYRSTILEELE